ncbi:ABC transporter ATP-binding protein [Catellatospora chokoriensis]|uniref:Peptide ABC transporter ATP-binding protein n=1 Tax=Catellatospora chokoriensis TaxID=310353 RepID=A0A8J3K9C5_9ACTN|nr:ABC transporter ATP-binding protein [Catellatospora chokoriensis]GIF91849.1 peptide ABC transporter ATP-binding protein [Catellatospora chokoriensis]
MTAVLQLDGVTRTYPGGVTAVHGVDLTVDRGELVAVVGPSGSGKSTLLHLVGLLDRPTAGTVRLAGFDTGALHDRSLSALRARAVGFVFQQFHLAPGVHALDAVADGLLYTGVPRGARRARAAETLRQVGLAERLTHRPHELSGGERQRVAIARALVKQPEVILADEPTGNLDSVSAAAVLDLLRQSHAAGTTVVVITHDQGIAQSLPRRVEMRDGRITRDTADRKAYAT